MKRAQRTRTLPTNQMTFGLFVIIRLFWIELFQAVTVGLLG